MPEQIFSDYVVIDTETTGFSSGDHIIEIAAIKVIGGNIVDTFSTLINPGVPIPASATRVNGITDAMVQAAPTTEQALQAALAFWEGYPIVGHNVQYDLRMLNQECCCYALPLFEAETADTMNLSRKVFCYCHQHRLSDCCERLHIENQSAHRALADVYATYECYEAMKTMPCQDPAGMEPPKPLCQWQQIATPDLSSTIFCLTGELTSLSRDDAENLIVSLHGIVKNNVSKKVHYLVKANEYDPNAKNGISSKTRRAMELIESGCPIQIIAEDAFMELLGFQKTAP